MRLNSSLGFSLREVPEMPLDQWEFYLLQETRLADLEWAVNDAVDALDGGLSGWNIDPGQLLDPNGGLSVIETQNNTSTPGRISVTILHTSSVPRIVSKTISATVEGIDIVVNDTGKVCIVSDSDTTQQLISLHGDTATPEIEFPQGDGLIHGAGDLIWELGDAAGVNKVTINDSAAAEQAYINSDGDILFNGDLFFGGTTASETKFSRSGTTIEARLGDGSTFTDMLVNKQFFGGTTSSFPMIKRDSAAVAMRLGDDSAYTASIASKYQLGGTSASEPMVSANGTAVETKLADDSAYAGLVSDYLNLGAADATGLRLRQNTASGSVVEFKDGDGTGNADVQTGKHFFEGTTSSFPMIKRDSAAVAFRLGDDSGYTAGVASKIQLGGTSATEPMVSASSTTAEVKLADDSAYTTLKSGDALPGVTATFDLGSASLIWEEAHVNEVISYNELVVPNTAAGDLPAAGDVRVGAVFVTSDTDELVFYT